MQTLQGPTTVSELQFFLEMRNVCWRFVQNYAKLAALLNNRLNEREPLQYCFDEEETIVVNIFMGKLVTLPVLALPQSNGQCTKVANVCDTPVE